MVDKMIQKKILRKPSRKLYEQECKRLENEIESLRSKLNEIKAKMDELFKSLDKMKMEKNTKFAEKSDLEQTIRTMSVDINKLSEKLAQLQSKVQYRNMKHLDEAIKKLQVHLDSHHFKISEEKKIVAEIDKLNRSKKVVGEYAEVQMALKELRDTQHSRRAERDKCIRCLVEIRNKEEDLKKNIDDCKTKETAINCDIDSLCERKKQVKDEFAKEQQVYADEKKTFNAIKQEEQESRKQVKPRLVLDTRLSQEPVVKEVKICQQLIDYCRKLNGNDKVTHKPRKPISYTPDILTQFMAVDISPPLIYQQLNECISNLQDKIRHLTNVQQTPNAINTEPSDPDTVDTECARSTPPDLYTQLEESDGLFSHFDELPNNALGEKFQCKDIVSILDNLKCMSLFEDSQDFALKSL